MTIETDSEFDAGTSPCINTDPRLPRQHTLDAHQLRVLHRAIDTLAFTAQQCRAYQTAGAKIPPAVAQMIDATVSAWEPVKDELVAQTAQYQRGE